MRWWAGYLAVLYQLVVCVRRRSYHAAIRGLRALLVTAWTDVLGRVQKDVECPYCGWRGYRFRPIYIL